jgi:hypothetical protein
MTDLVNRELVTVQYILFSYLVNAAAEHDSPLISD